MRGLLVRQPWLDLILSGAKVWELRSRPTRKRGKIFLVDMLPGGRWVVRGSVRGSVRIVRVVKLTRRRFARGRRKHRVRTYARQFQYAWVLAEPRRLRTARRVPRKPGAVVWVRLP
jgi:hypothetical protein